MNRMIGALAVLLLVTAVAMGQQSPFPSAANPSLEPNTNQESAVTLQRVELPASMAANTSYPVTEWRYEFRNDFANESQFPTAANPSLTTGTNTDMPTVIVEQSSRIDSESSFPQAANPSNQ
jgi:hypothetical protein